MRHLIKQIRSAASPWSLAALLLVSSAGLRAQQVKVRYPEGTVHGFLALKNAAGKQLAEGDLTQTVQGDQVTLRLVFRFHDGSLDSDTAVFSQHGRFRLLSDHHNQTGPSYPEPTDMTIDATHDVVTVRYRKKGKQKVVTEHMDLPDDLSNGDIFDVMKNISREAPETRLSYIAPTPRPRIVTLSITPQNVDTFQAAGFSYKAQHLNVRVELGGIAGLVAPLLGKQPDDLNVWISSDGVPAFLRIEGPLYLGGPMWTVELTSPVLSHTH